MAHIGGAEVSAGVGVYFVSHTSYIRMTALHHTYACVSHVCIRQIRMRHVTHMNVSCRIDE